MNISLLIIYFEKKRIRQEKSAHLPARREISGDDENYRIVKLHLNGIRHNCHVALRAYKNVFDHLTGERHAAGEGMENTFHHP